jgi:hypothetical protein
LPLPFTCLTRTWLTCSPAPAENEYDDPSGSKVSCVSCHAESVFGGPAHIRVVCTYRLRTRACLCTPRLTIVILRSLA